MNFEMTVGLETHFELSTKSKIFCSCPNCFGGEANTKCCPVCLGLPGSLPVLNREVVEYAVKAGLALNCRVEEYSYMARKNYIYPDLPKAYQITQGDRPICHSGQLNLSDGSVIRINRLHIEEDAGKLIHKDGATFADYNRCGVPLVEIVTEPDFNSAEQVREYLEKLRLIMKTLGVSDCRMQEGSMRCDVNLSVKKREDKKPGEKIEIKNVNSFSFIAKAINYEYKRQCSLLERGERITAQTRRFNEATGETESMRDKEEGEDYRYFPEPDIPAVYISHEEIVKIKKTLPELPDAKYERYIEEYNLTADEAVQIIKYPAAVDYFERLIKLSGNAKLSAKLLVSNIFACVREELKRENGNFPNAEYIAEVVMLIERGKLKGGAVKTATQKITAENKPFKELFNITDFAGMSDEETAALADKAIAENQTAVRDYLAGKDRAIFAVVGKVMKESKGRADAEKVLEYVKKAINEVLRGK